MLFHCQVRVDLTGDATQKVFDKVLANLARSAPPIPGFRREKGGKTTKVPKDFLLQILGEDRVTKFVVQEIVSSTMTDYSKKASHCQFLLHASFDPTSVDTYKCFNSMQENLNVKEKKVTTTQSAEELKKVFTPGNEFGFNAIMELGNSEAEEKPEAEGESDVEVSSSSSSDL
ncbi:hypothetical protein Pint_26064 [Pistacia integerrima]|uniref:Uncharacterized protein n=1 Tax=Pistacia integerrima TaxID=434235 RepID=A0ACC0YB02_9ROSI|nr:hypothetical protein Pint_26064 [Pistacia integerrima]